MEDRKDVNVTMIILIIILIIVGVTLLFLFNKTEGYLIIDKTIVLSKSGNNIRKVSDYNENMFKEKYHIVGDFGEMDNIIINRSSTGEWNYMDKDYKSIDVNNVTLAYSGNFKNVKLADYDFSYYDSSYDSILKKALGDRDISKFTYSVRRSSMDFNGDGKLESIYTLTNVDSAVSKENRYSLIFLESNGKVVTIDEEKEKEFMVESILDLDNDGKYEVVVNKGALDVSLVDDSYQIYKINGDSFKCIMNS